MNPQFATLQPQKVLEAVSAQNVKLLAASGVVVAGFVDAAKAGTLNPETPKPLN